jgi:hypothetical protein
LQLLQRLQYFLPDRPKIPRRTKRFSGTAEHFGAIGTQLLGRGGGEPDDLRARQIMSIQSQEGNRGFFQSAGGQVMMLSIAIVLIVAIAWAYVF